MKSRPPECFGMTQPSLFEEIEPTRAPISAPASQESREPEVSQVVLAVGLDEHDQSLISLVQSYGAKNQSVGYAKEQARGAHSDVVQRYGSRQAERIREGMAHSADKQVEARRSLAAKALGTGVLRRAGLGEGIEGELRRDEDALLKSMEQKFGGKGPVYQAARRHFIAERTQAIAQRSKVTAQYFR